MFKFVHITHLDDIRHAISEDFFLAERDWGYVINYHIGAFPEIKDDMSDEDKALEYARREFRGIKFDRQGNLIARPFHKFFNWGEKEAEMAYFDFSQPFVIMDKLDGSMIHPMYVGDRMVWCSKMGPTEVAEQVETFVKANDRYAVLAAEMLLGGMLPIFEWCSRKQRIVVDYPEDQLILTAIRDMATGQYVPYDDMKDIGKDYDIPVVKTWKGNFAGIDQFLTEIGGEEQCEGYIIRFENGHMVKLKNAWYLNLHRAKSQLENEKNVYRLVLSESHDDLLPQLDPDARRALEDFAAALAQQVKLVASRYEAGVHHARQAWPLRKDFAINFATKQDLPAVIFKILDGKPAYDAVVDWLMDQTSTQAKLDAAKAKFGNINWRSYYYPVDMDG